jgi:transcriptional regulator
MDKKRHSDRNELLPGTLDMLILKTLSRGTLHGYGIARHIRQMSDEVLQVEEGSLYPALQRLQVKGWVESAWQTSPKNRRARYYCLTPAGKRQLQAEESAIEQSVSAIARVMRPA